MSLQQSTTLPAIAVIIRSSNPPPIHGCAGRHGCAKHTTTALERSAAGYRWRIGPPFGDDWNQTRAYSFWRQPSMRCCSTTVTVSPASLAIVLRKGAAIGSLCVPSPSAMNELRNG